MPFPPLFLGFMDYDPTVLDIVLTPRVTQLTLRIPIINDNIVEEAEHFTGSLVSDDVMIFLGTTRVDILDDDIDRMLSIQLLQLAMKSFLKT